MVQQKQRLQKARADFEQTIVNKATNQWSKRLADFVKTLNTHYLRHLALCKQTNCFKQL